MPITPRTALALAAAALLAGCAGDTGTGTRTLPGEVRLRYAGHVSGEYFGTAIVVPAGGVDIRVEAQRPHPADGFSYFHLDMAEGGPRTMTCPEGEPGCPFHIEFQPDRAWYESTGGTVTITSIQQRRMRGTFSATLQLRGGRPDQTIQVTSGTFDVPVGATAD